MFLLLDCVLCVLDYSFYFCVLCYFIRKLIKYNDWSDPLVRLRVNPGSHREGNATLTSCNKCIITSRTFRIQLAPAHSVYWRIYAASYINYCRKKGTQSSVPSVIHVGLRLPVMRGINKRRWNFRKADWTKYTAQLRVLFL